MLNLGQDNSIISEKEIIEEYNRTSHRGIRTSILFGLAFFNAFAIYDYYIFPPNFINHLNIRLGIVTPYWIAVFVLLGKPRYRAYTRQLVLSGAILCSLCLAFFYKNNFSLLKTAAPVGLVFFAMYFLSSMRLLRREAFIFAAVTLLSVATVLVLENADALGWFSYLFHCAVACALGLVVSDNIEQAWRKMVEQKKIVERQEAEATSLLQSIFPISIANRLRKNSDSIAERCDEVSILFADIQGFTAAAAKLSPTELVNDLNVVFSRIDDLCAKHGCEKIKTIGDAYLAVAGVPTHAPDHADRIVRLALAMQALSKEITIGGQPVTFRIGIHSGPVVAGVIGKSRFAYDLWGDSVNMASRMESIAPPGSIQISAETASLLGSAFILESRGKIYAKGKGEVATWLVTGEATPQAAYYFEDNKKSA